MLVCALKKYVAQKFLLTKIIIWFKKEISIAVRGAVFHSAPGSANISFFYLKRQGSVLSGIYCYNLVL